jgi:ABC-2 type transport system ATP-binding protein
MIEIRSLSKHFGSLIAVDGASFRVGEGEVLGFLGPNGAGKSTTMKMLTGFLRPTAGTAVVRGHDVVEDPLSVKECMGYLPEGAPAYPDMTPAGFLDFVGRVRGMDRGARRRRVAEVVQTVHLAGVMRQSIETLSKGYKRRVGLAQAILHDPPVLIMDEPTDGLDPNQKHEVRGLIRAMAGSGGERAKGVVLSTHILEEVEAVCTRTVIISRGRIVFDGAPDELAARSRHHNAVLVSVRGVPAGDLREKLRRVDGVSEVEALPGEPGLARARAFARGGRSILEGVSAAAREAGGRVDELRVERGRLDEVFRELTGAPRTGAAA